MNASFEKIVEDLKKLSLREGDSVVVHSSLKSMGNVEGGAKTVISALSHVIGESGTLLFPAFTFATSYGDSQFSILETPACIGVIAETFRREEGVLRSFHPTHSVCAKGPLAKAYIEGHELDETPMGPNSPYQKLSKYNAKILFLGCGLAPNSFFHALEEVAKLPYTLRDKQVYTMTDAEGKITQKGIRRHNFARPDGKIYQNYQRAPEILELGVDYVCGTVHGATSYLMDADRLEKKAVEKMKEDPYFFIKDPDGILKK